MANRVMRLVCVLAAGVLTVGATQGCVYGKKRTRTGTNLGSADEEYQLPPPGQPSLTREDDVARE